MRGTGARGRGGLGRGILLCRGSWYFRLVRRLGVVSLAVLVVSLGLVVRVEHGCVGLGIVGRGWSCFWLGVGPDPAALLIRSRCAGGFTRGVRTREWERLWNAGVFGGSCRGERS